MANKRIIKKTVPTEDNKPLKEKCGIIMPISGFIISNSKGNVEYTEQRWRDIRLFLEETILDAGFEPCLVWEGNESSLIQASIVENLREFPLTVCVICGLNANVMTELGMRIAFNKQVVIVSDDNTPFPFDISSIKAAKYPYDGSYSKIIECKKQLIELLKDSAKPNHKTFLHHFTTKLEPSDDIDAVDKVKIADFMNKTRNAIQALNQDIVNIKSQEERKLFSDCDDDIKKMSQNNRFNTLMHSIANLEIDNTIKNDAEILNIETEIALGKLPQKAQSELQKALRRKLINSNASNSDITTTTTTPSFTF